MEDKNQKLSIKEIELKANDIRKDIISMLLEAQSGHTAGPLGMADVFAALYFNILKHDPKNPSWPGRDRMVLSCGHICPVLYAALAESGYFPKEELMTLRKLGSRLQGHPHNLDLPGIENSSGPLAQGLSQAVGMAIAAKMDHAQHRIYCVCSDGEQDEGQIWEALMLAGKKRLNNLTVILDRNNIQIDGYTEDVMPLEPLRAKYEAFNWHVIEIDGNNPREVIDACNAAKAIFEKPVLIMAHTIPGKGVGFMEFNYEWHGMVPKEPEAEKALAELRTLRGAIQSEHE
jgi:transketolase